jgi:hypothetical protein
MAAAWPKFAELQSRHPPPITRRLRRGARVVDRDGLENRCTFTGTVGSNPTLSASEPFTSVTSA